MGLGNYLKTGGPGRPKGSVNGRRLAMQTLDKMLSKDSNQRHLGDAIQERFWKDPAAFMLEFVYPTLPREVRAELALRLGSIILDAAEDSPSGTSPDTADAADGA